jgi:acyl-CoA synthetase (AMP-forming)/AMP-acid ligase II
VKELVFSRQLLPAIERGSDRIAFYDGDYQASFAQHLARVEQLCGALASLGVGRGDRFAVMALNSHQFLECYHAAFLGGGVVNPLNLRLAPKELEYIIGDSETKVCFTDAFFAPAIDKVRETAGIEHVVMIGSGDAPHDVTYEELLASATPALPEEPEEDDPVVLMYTGGTTGLPKGVLLDQRAEMINLYHISTTWLFNEQDVFLHQTPMFHAASMGGMLGVPSRGGTSVFLPLFDPAQTVGLIEQYGVTTTVMVPTMIGMMLENPEFRAERLASLRQLTYGASPMPAALLERLLSLLPDIDILQGYGMTESSAVLTALGPDEHRAGGPRLRSAGRPLLGVELSIQDPKGNILPSGETGEVCARAGNFMREYWKKPDATADAFRGGWYHSGDAGYLDADGYLYLVDRVKDMIVTGGENVYSIEVENALASHPAVVQVAVIGVPSEKWGESVHAVVVVLEGADVSADELIAHAREYIAGYKVPKSIEFRAEPLPLSGAMKVLKRDLRAPYWEGQERAVN